MGDNLVQPEQEQLKDIVNPHANDVLSGRGNFVNHHSGNENFRNLVKHHKKAYVACPKAQKAIYSKIIYDEIRAMNPPGRFLKQDPKTKLWSDIGEKKALDKTRQALREGAPELLKELETGGDGSGGDDGGEDFVAPLRASRNMLAESMMGNISLGSFSLGNSFNTAAQMSFMGSFTTGPGNSFTTGPGNSFTTGPGSSFTTGPGSSFTTGPGNSFTTGPGNSFTVPQQVGGNNSHLFDSQGTNSILTAAAQLQAQQLLAQAQQQQQQQQQPDQNTSTAEMEAQLNILKQHMQMNPQQDQSNMSSPQQQGGGGGSAGNNAGNDQNAGFNAMLNNGNGPMGSDQMTALLAAIHNSASGLNSGPRRGSIGGGNNAALQQQLSMLNRLGSSERTLVTGNMHDSMNLGQVFNDGQGNQNPMHNSNSSMNNQGAQMHNSNSSMNGQMAQQMNSSNSSINNQTSQQTKDSGGVMNNQMAQMHNSSSSMNGRNNNMGTFNNASSSDNQATFGSIAEHPQQPQQQQQQQYQPTYQDTSVPLKSPSTTEISTPSPATMNRRPARDRGGGGGLTSSFTRAQRIGLKNSFTRRPNRHMTHAELQSSLMSIESLTLDDIDSATESFGTHVFEEGLPSKGSGGDGKHGSGPHDMSEVSNGMSEVSELDFEEKA